MNKLSVLVLFAGFFYLTSACSDEDLYVIRCGAYSELVLDGSNSSSITLQFFTKSPAQLWKFERGSKAGLFYITNNQTGNVLDFEPTTKGLTLLAKPQRNSNRQQWNLRLDGRIVNNENRRNIDIPAGNYSPGTHIIVWADNGNQAQEFMLEKFKNVVEEEEKKDR